VDADFTRLTALQPYADLVLVVFNACVFEVTFHEELQGRISLDGQELRETPQMLEPRCEAAVKHGRETQVKLRQWISRDTAAEIKDKYPSGSQMKIGFGQLTILFEPVDDPLPRPRDQPHRLSLPTEQVFQVRY
jgi:hypothetical protein